MKYRQERLSSLIQNELSKIIGRIIEIPNALLTITEVEISKKLDHAKVYISVYPSEKSEEAIEMLKKRSGELRALLSKKVLMKTMPHISFELDLGPEKAAAIEKISLEVHKEE